MTDGSLLQSAAWDGLKRDLQDSGVNTASLTAVLDQHLASFTHGDMHRWVEALNALPQTGCGWDIEGPAARLGGAVSDGHSLKALLMELHPWRKGPLVLGGVSIDTEWRSDWKWQRVAPALDLRGKTVLDVGSGNGYFGWQMLAAGARCVVGIDPTALFVMQWLAQRHFSGPAPNYVLPLRDTDLPGDLGCFDVVLSMGVLYHRREPEDHLQRLRQCLASDGQLLLETLVVDGQHSLHPDGRYARMRNVHEVPTVQDLCRQLLDAGFKDPEVVDVTRTTIEEQRSTDWMSFESLEQCLDPENPSLTVEGHPAPLRAIIKARH